jgi:hypothetical protein
LFFQWCLFFLSLDERSVYVFFSSDNFMEIQRICFWWLISVWWVWPTISFDSLIGGFSISLNFGCPQNIQAFSKESSFKFWVKFPEFWFIFSE